MNISLCIITKDEEKNIESCIQSVNKLVNEIVVVDTGSVDRTVEIAKKYGAKIFYYEWQKDFAAARNYAIEQCKGDWIIFLDADEYMGKIEKKLFVKHIKVAQKLDRDALLTEIVNIEKDTKEFKSISKTIRVFKNRPSLRYEGAIHERLVHKNREIRLHNALEDIRIFHTGYSAEVLEEKGKGQRNLEILYSELEKDPTSANIHFYLIETLLIERKVEEALKHTYEVEKYNNGTIIGISTRNMYHRLKCLMVLKEREEVLLEQYKKAIELDTQFPDFDAVMADYYIQNSNYNEASLYLERAIKKMNQYNSIVESWVTSRPQTVYQTLANIYILMNRKAEAVKILVNILVTNKYEYDSLYKLISVLDGQEKSIDIFNFLVQIYDMNKLKDKIYLLKATRNMTSQFVYNMIYNLLTDEEQKMYMVE